MLEIFEFKSLNPGKKILITGSVHGNEVCGAIASNNIIEKIKSGEIKLKNGSITFIPVCNPMASKENKRYIDVNLNRVIRKKKKPQLYEEKIANILTDYIKSNEFHLDLHSMHTNGNPFVFQDYEDEAEFAKIFNLEYIFINWPGIYKNSKTIKDYSTQNYAHKVGNINCTVECGSHNDIKSIDVAELCILRALSYLDIIDYKDNIQIKPKLINMEKVIFKEFEGKFSKNYENLDKVKKGEIIATYSNGKTIVADYDCLIIFPNNNANISDEWFYFGKMI